MTSFLGMSNLEWQFISGLPSTMIIGTCRGVVSPRWLNKCDLLDEEEEKLPVQRVDCYKKLLDYMAELENKVVLFDPQF